LGSLLPLFPLELVLLPGMLQPLHIFEPRYKQMIGECLAEKSQFGIVRLKEDGIAEVGCTAEILEVVKTYPDGRMDIVSQGRERFQVTGVHQDMPYLRAEVQILPDAPGRPAAGEAAQAVKLHADILALAGDTTEALDPQDAHLSFHLAGSLPLDLDFKQMLLSTASEAKRIQVVIAYFEAILPKLRRSVEVRRKAGGNGHAH